MLRVISELRPAWVVGENVAGLVNLALDQVLSDLEGIGYACQALIIPACAVDAAHRRDRCAIIGCRAMERKHNGRGRRTYSLENSDCVGFGEPGVLSQQQGRAKFERDGKDVAHAESIGLQREWSGGDQIGGTRPEKAQPERRCDVLSDADNRGRSLWRDGELPTVEETGGNGTDHRGRAEEYVTGKRWTTQPGLGGVVDGVPAWMDRYWVEEPDIPRVTTVKKNRVDRLKCLGNAVYWRQFYPIFQGIMEVMNHA